MKLLLTILLLSGCTLRPVIPPAPITESYEVNVIGLEYCDKAWGKAVSYLYSEGIRVSQNYKAKKTFLCIPDQSAWIKIVSTLLVPIPEAQGYSRGNIAWAKILGFENQDSKVIIHELMHLLKGEPHHWRGLMFPISDFLVFYSSM